MSEPDIIISVVVISLTLFVLVILILLLLVFAANRKNRHRAELLELERQKNQEVMKAEREATQATMKEIGQELHDNVQQLISAAQIGLQSRFADEIQHDLALTTTVETLEQAVDEVGRLGRTLNTDWWGNRDLFEAIGEEAARAERMGTCVVHLNQNGDRCTLSTEASTILFRVFQEVLGNALKHSKTKVVRINLVSAPFMLQVIDEGIGFDANANEKGSGRNNIRKRCELIGLSVRLDTAPGKGCKWTFTNKIENEL